MCHFEGIQSVFNDMTEKSWILYVRNWGKPCHFDLSAKVERSENVLLIPSSGSRTI
ncbi:MAG: hypothetical protein WCE54_01010 [Ignavibacteriaceae bacterium]